MHRDVTLKEPPYWGWLRVFQFAPRNETMGHPLFVGIYRGIMIPGFLGWCRISSIHSRDVTLMDPEGRGSPGFLLREPKPRTGEMKKTTWLLRTLGKISWEVASRPFKHSRVSIGLPDSGSGRFVGMLFGIHATSPPSIGTEQEFTCAMLQMLAYLGLIGLVTVPLAS